MSETNYLFFDAIYANDISEVLRLLDEGVSPYEKNNAHETPLIYASSHGQLDIVKILLDRIERGGGHEALPVLEAAVPDDTSVLDFFLQQGADPNVADEHGHTPLMEAASWHNKEAVRLLVQYGADVNAVNMYGKSAVDAAEAQGYVDIAHLLKLQL